MSPVAAIVRVAAIALVTATILLLTARALAATAFAPQTTSQRSQARCGVERWVVKTLTDADARRVSFAAIPSHVHDLVSLQAPSHLGSRRIAPLEFHAYRVRAALVTAKLEADSDIHLVIAELGTGESMIAELPSVACTYGAQHRYAMAKARIAFEAACPALSARRFTSLTGSASVTGVGFWDRIHGQRGVAPNGVELHPVIRFFAADCRGR